MPFFPKRFERKKVILNDSLKKSNFLAFFYPYDSYEADPCKKACVKRAFWLKPQAHTSKLELQKYHRTWYCLNDK